MDGDGDQEILARQSLSQNAGAALVLVEPGASSTPFNRSLPRPRPSARPTAGSIPQALGDIDGDGPARGLGRHHAAHRRHADRL